MADPAMPGIESEEKSPQAPKNRRHRLIRRGFLLALTIALLLLLIEAYFSVLLFKIYTPRCSARMSAVRSYLFFEVRPAQMSVRDDSVLDRDGDGKGEFGTLGDLLPVAERIGATEFVNQMDEFRPALNEARVWSSYLLKIYVPEDADMSERTWCAVAWPAVYRRDARYTLVYWVGPDFPAGRIRRVEDRRYSGWGNGPRLGDIFSGEPFRSDIDQTRWAY